MLGARARAPLDGQALASLPVLTDPGEIPRVLVLTEDGAPPGEPPALPLRSTRVVARLAGPFAEVEVQQTFGNPRLAPVEVAYVFPLPENAAVIGMKLVAGDRTIDARVDERGRARATYQAARRAGLPTALLEQERANVFVQSVANVPAGKELRVTTRYLQDLSFDAGVYEFVFPMVVGPREPAGASRITPPYVGRGERSGADVSLELFVDGGLPASAYQAVTHAVTSREVGDGTVHVVLDPKPKIANRDFVLRYDAAAETPRAALRTSGGRDGEGFFALTIDPPAIDVDAEVGRREVVFLVDVSGSMAGPPLGLAKRALALALGELRPVDTFNVLAFSHGTARLFDAARPVSHASIEEAQGFLDRMQAGGGTFFVDAIGEALAPDVADGRHRYVFLLTDGYVAADDLIVRSTRKMVDTLEAKGLRGRVFGLGVGAAPNRALLEAVAREGKGAAVYASLREDPARAVNQFFRMIDHSVLRDVSVDWQGATVTDVVPSVLPDLFASRSLVVHGRYRGTPPTGAVVRATSSAGPVELVAGVAGAPRRELLLPLWARAKIGELDTRLALGDVGARQDITRLGLRHNLVTRFTSFVAFDPAGRGAGGPPELVPQPAELPEGTLPQFRSPEAPGDLPRAEATSGSAPPAPPQSEVARGGRGCFCSAPGSGPDRGALLLALAAALAIARRRGR